MGCKRRKREGCEVVDLLLVSTAILCILSCTSCKPFPGVTSKASLVFPVYVRHGVTRSRSLLRNGTLPVLGAVREVGYFYTHLWLGTPPRHFSVIIDTGSTITYIPCKSCRHCGRHQDAAFDPGNSSTYKSVGCTSPKCNCGSPPCDCMRNKCSYYRTYAEQSSSEGWLIEDNYYFPDNVTTVPVIFGCEDNETGEIYRQMADGILGMGNNDIAFHSQLHSAGVIDDTFGLCFAWPSGGAMLLGDVSLPNISMSYTPMVEQPMHLHYYNIKLTGIRVGDAMLDLPYRKLFDAGYGTVMDSGTTFTYFPSAAYVAFKLAVEAVARDKGLEEVYTGDYSFRDYCWRGAPSVFEDLDSVFPTAEIVFEGNAALRLTPLRYLFMMNPGTYCLGIFDNYDSGALIGGISVRNVLVQYDGRNKRYGFGEADCSAIGLDAAASALNPLSRSMASKSAPTHQQQAPHSRPTRSPAQPIIDLPTPSPSPPSALNSEPWMYMAISAALIAIVGLVTLALYLLRNRAFGYEAVANSPMDQPGVHSDSQLKTSAHTDSLEMPAVSTASADRDQIAQ